MDFKTLLSLGLQKGFGGETTFKTIQRDQFTLQSSHYKTENNDIYHDEWLADRIGGGQELVKIGDKSYTRVYAGGTVEIKKLEELGIKKTDILIFLKDIIVQHGSEIRLSESALFESTEWKYRYTILDDEESIPVTTGKESIYYKNTLVFVHIFLICPVE